MNTVLGSFLLSERSLDGFYIHIFDGWFAQQLLDGVDLVAGDGPVPAAFAL